MSIELVVVASDTHCGSRLGLLPPDVLDSEGAVYSQNPYQQWAWQKWEEIWAKVDAYVAGRPWAFVGNGDLVEGMHHRSVEVVDADASAHSNIAIAALKPRVESASKVFLVEGTEVHTRSEEFDIGIALNAERDPQTKAFLWKQLQLNINGVLTHFKHHMPPALRAWTQSSAFAGVLVQEQASAAALGHPIPRVLVRSHRHNFGVYRSVGGVVVATYPWQAMTRHARKVVQASITPLGIQILDFSRMVGNNLPHVEEYVAYPDPDPVVTL